MTEVFKVGGASVKDADGIKNLAKIVQLNRDKLLIVVSAMGKTTNALEELAKAYTQRREDAQQVLAGIKEYHENIMLELFGTDQHAVFDEINNAFVEIDWILEDEPQDDFDFIYDQIVSIGETTRTSCRYYCHNSRVYRRYFRELHHHLRTRRI